MKDEPQGPEEPSSSLVQVSSPEGEKKQEGSTERRMLSVDMMKVLVGLAIVCLGALGGIYWKLWDLSKDIGVLTSRVDGYNNEAFMKLFSSIQTGKESSPVANQLRETVEHLVQDTVQKGSKGEPVPPGLYYEFGIFSWSNGKTENAIEYFKQAIAGNPLDYRALSSLGACYLFLALEQKDQTDYYANKAVEVLKQAIQVKPDHINAHNNLGIAYYLMGQRAAAIDEWNSAIKIDYKDDSAYYQFACMYAREKDTQKALEFLEKAVVNYGYSNLAGLDEEADFKDLRSQPRFVRLREMVVTRSKNAVSP